MTEFDNTYPYSGKIRFNPDYINEVYNDISQALMLEFNDNNREVCLDSYSVTIFDKIIEVRFRDLDRPFITKIMNLISIAVNGAEYYWWIYDSVNNASVLEDPIQTECDNIVEATPHQQYIGLGFHNPEYLNESDSENESESENKNDSEEKDESHDLKKEIPLEEMGDIDIAEYIKKIGCEPDIENCKIWNFKYDPTNPCLYRFSYGTFENCTIPKISFQFTDKQPLIIRSANFNNVNFEKCCFLHVVFLDCSFRNCDFSNAVVEYLTINNCIISETNLNLPNVFIM